MGVIGLLGSGCGKGLSPVPNLPTKESLSVGKPTSSEDSSSTQSTEKKETSEKKDTGSSTPAAEAQQEAGETPLVNSNLLSTTLSDTVASSFKLNATWGKNATLCLILGYSSPDTVTGYQFAYSTNGHTLTQSASHDLSSTLKPLKAYAVWSINGCAFGGVLSANSKIRLIPPNPAPPPALLSPITQIELEWTDVSQLYALNAWDGYESVVTQVMGRTTTAGVRQVAASYDLTTQAAKGSTTYSGTGNADISGAPVFDEPFFTTGTTVLVGAFVSTGNFVPVTLTLTSATSSASVGSGSTVLPSPCTIADLAHAALAAYPLNNATPSSSAMKYVLILDTGGSTRCLVGLHSVLTGGFKLLTSYVDTAQAKPQVRIIENRSGTVNALLGFLQTSTGSTRLKISKLNMAAMTLSQETTLGDGVVQYRLISKPSAEKAFVVWMQGTSLSNRKVYLARFQNGEWGEPKAISAGQGFGWLDSVFQAELESTLDVVMVVLARKDTSASSSSTQVQVKLFSF
jgi:hypothetical protein